MCGWAGAWLGEDVVLSADDPTLKTLAENVIIALGKIPPERNVVAWRIDQAALRLLAKQQADSQLSPELSAVLADRAGEAGRHPATLEEIMADLHGPEELSRRLSAANVLYLQDSSPASRARTWNGCEAATRRRRAMIRSARPGSRRAALEKAAANRAAGTQPAGVP